MPFNMRDSHWIAGGTGELRAFLGRQAIYHLSHASSPLCSGYAGGRVLLFAGLQSSYFMLPAVTGMTGAHPDTG
jgi:hypothetical protein